MSRVRLVAAGLAIVAALGAGTATAAPATPAWNTQVSTLMKGDKQFTKLATKVAPCAAAAPTVASARKVRAVAVRNWRAASVRGLRAKNVRMRAAVLRLAKAANSCGLAVPANPGAPVVVTPGTGGFTTTPGTPGAPGAPGAPGGGATSITLDLPIRTVLDGLPIDLTAVLNGGVLPQVIQLVPSTGLTDPVCSTVGTACVGINPATLSSVLTTVTAGVPLVGGLVTQVVGALTGGDLSGLFTVQRVSDTVVRIVPAGPLATVRALLGSLAGAPTTAVAILKATR